MALQVKRVTPKRVFPPPKAAAAAASRGRRKHILEKVVAAEKAEKKKLAAAERRRLKAEEKKRLTRRAARLAGLKTAILPLIIARDGVREFGRALYRTALNLWGRAIDTWRAVIRFIVDCAKAAGALTGKITLGFFDLVGSAVLKTVSTIKAVIAWLPQLNPLPYISRAATRASTALKQRIDLALAAASRFAERAREALGFLHPRRLVTYSYAVAIGASLVIVGGQIGLQISADVRDREAAEAMASYQTANNVPAETEAAIAILRADNVSPDIPPATEAQTGKNAVVVNRAPKPATPETARAKSAINLNKVEPPVPSATAVPRVKPRPKKYAGAYPGNFQRPLIAVVIDDMGMVQGELKRFARLPKEITFAFLPYSPNLEYQTRVMRDNGHELIVHLPMEPKRRTADPGPQALLTGLSDFDLGQRIAWNLGRFEGFTGINNHMGSRFTEDPRVMRAVMSALKKRNLYFLDSMTTAASVGVPMATEYGVPQAQRDIFLDNKRDYNAILRQLRKAERIAERRGHVIAIGHPHRITYQVLRDWTRSLRGKNIQLVPLSALILHPAPDIKIAESTVVTELSRDMPAVERRTITSSAAAAGLR